MEYEIIGESVDDAVGEAFDKVARILGLPIPAVRRFQSWRKHAEPEKNNLYGVSRRQTDREAALREHAQTATPERLVFLWFCHAQCYIQKISISLFPD